MLSKIFSRLRKKGGEGEQPQSEEGFLDEILMKQDIDRISDNVIKMGENTHDMILNSLSVLSSDKDEDALALIEEDQKIDRMEMEINWECLASMAMRQPVQDDLRFLFAVIKLTTDLERVGDESTNIARHLLLHRDFLKRSDDIKTITYMKDCVAKQLKDVTTAFANKDLSMARYVFTQDEVIDRYYDHLYESFLSNVSASDNEEVRRQAYTLTLARHLERAGDHIINIAEYICFMLTGKRITSDLDPNKD